MATGASHADLAILLVDARHGAKRQTRRHAAICDLVGIKKVVLAVNKMDEVDWSEARYREIEADFRAHGRELQFRASHHHSGGGAHRRQCGLPLDADALVCAGRRCSIIWRRSIPRRCQTDAPFRMPVQLVLRASGDFRGYAGTVTSGRIKRRRADRRCAERAWRHAAAHLDHGRRP